MTSRAGRAEAAALARRDRLLLRIVRRRILGIELAAVVRIALEHDARGALPLRDAERVRPHRALHDPLARRLDHFARDCAHQVAVRQVVEQVRLRLGEADAVGIAIDRLDPLHVPVVIELPAFHRCLAHFVQAGHQLVHQVQVLRLELRVEVALQRVNVILRDELAFVTSCAAITLPTFVVLPIPFPRTPGNAEF